MLHTCVCVPDVRHPVLAAREEEVPTWCESAVDPLSVVYGSAVLLHSQTERSRWFYIAYIFTCFIMWSTTHWEPSSCIVLKEATHRYSTISTLCFLSHLHSQVHHPQDTAFGMDEQAPPVRMELQHVDGDTSEVTLLDFLQGEDVQNLKFPHLSDSAVCVPAHHILEHIFSCTFSMHQRWDGWRCLPSLVLVFHTMMRPV